MKLRALAAGKVNLCLYLGQTRTDGRHELLTLFQSLSLADTLTAAPATTDEVICAGVSGENLALTALTHLRARGWDGPPLTIEIEKRIPVAAGMAGGSADAAAALRLATAIKPFAPEDVEQIAAGLGSDVPSQLVSGACLGSGAGDLIERLDPLPEHAYVVLPSRFQLSTADVYRESDRLGSARSHTELEQLRASLLAALAERDSPLTIVNDLQPATLSLCPPIQTTLDAALAAGADHAIVSGSGPTVVGIWFGKDAATRAASAVKTLVKAHPGAVAAVPVGPRFGLPEAIF